MSASEAADQPDAGPIAEAEPEITSQVPGTAGPGREPRRRRVPSDRSYVQCAAHGEKIVLAFPYDTAMVQDAKAIGGRTFDWDSRTNIYPFPKLPQVVAFADTHGISVSPHIRALVPAAATLVRAEAAQQQAVRNAAYLYLRHGLLPVPAWAATADGACHCPRGTACRRPGKHPRSIHAGPGPRDYSWKPLACSTQQDIEQRFGPGQEYAGANLMLAIPEGTLVIDQDLDDGGRHGLTMLARHLGELPVTLGHDTPHGTHLIYRTPPGWTTRAWVGKDARNPLPAGIDLRVPGQILMAPPSQVPYTGRLVSYGPTAGTAIADLPGVYLDAWTPQHEQARPARRGAPGPPGTADVAAAYIHARMDGIVGDLAALQRGGRNAAIYTAALKVGSSLAAARSTPGVEQAVAEWTDQAAEETLMRAAEQNGYISDHSSGEARSAIRSGFRNGLRNPRPLPDFGRSRAPINMTHQKPQSDPESGREVSTSDAIGVNPASIRDPGKAGSRRSQVASSCHEPRSGSPQQIGDWRDAVASSERGDWRPEVPRHSQAVVTKSEAPEVE